MYKYEFGIFIVMSNVSTYAHNIVKHAGFIFTYLVHV